jgi:UDP-N-acetylmuramyl pentapeptide phosphotransferase/UDP-N-acetylglucosamine-1-phosphate transferase
MHISLLIFALGILAGVVTYWGVACFRHWAIRTGLFDVPNPRSSHVAPVPRGGGLMVVATVLILAAICGPLILAGKDLKGFLLCSAGALVVAAISWMDDLRSISSISRLLVHLVCAFLAIGGLGYWQVIYIPMLGPIHLGYGGLILTAIWIVGLTNAYNFMDGTDGIAAGQAIAAGLGWAVLGWIGGVPLISALGFFIACSSAGFLIHNWPPASIFMGDVGSAFLGYSFAVLPLLYTRLNGDSRSFLFGILLVWPFVFDTLFTLLRRLLRGENIFQAHRSHLYQRLTTPTSGHKNVAILYFSLASLGVLLALGWILNVPGIETVAGPVIFLLFLLMLAFVRFCERRRSPQSEMRS